MSAMSSFDPDRRAALRLTAAGAAALAAGFGQGRAQAATRTIAVERLSVVSAKPFETVVAAFESSIGRPDMNAFMKDLSATQTYEEMEKVVQQAIGKSGIMEFARFDLGFILRKEPVAALQKACAFWSAIR